MKHLFEGKKVFIICSAPDPKIDYEKVKDHVWVCLKGSGWSIENEWKLDRVPDVTYMVDHLNYRLEPMFKHLKTKTLVHFLSSSALIDPFANVSTEYVIKQDIEDVESFYKEMGMQFEEIKLGTINIPAFSFRSMVEANYFIHAGQFFADNVSFGIGVTCLAFDAGATEVVLSGLSIKKGKHSYSGRDLTKNQVYGLHRSEDSLSLRILHQTGYDVKTFEPELNRVCGIPMK
jgi:hypothetical protein